MQIKFYFVLHLQSSSQNNKEYIKRRKAVIGNELMSFVAIYFLAKACFQFLISFLLRQSLLCIIISM